MSGGSSIPRFMKTLTIIGFTVVVLIVVVFLWGPQRKHFGDLVVNQRLPGTWVETGKDGVRKTIVIDPDGHSVMRTSRGVTAEGTTLVKDGFLVSTITNSSQSMTLPFTQSVQIIRMDDRELVLRGDRNTEVVYKKKP